MLCLTRAFGKIGKIGTKTVVQARLFQMGSLGIFSGMHRPYIIYPLAPDFGSSGLTALFLSA